MSEKIRVLVVDDSALMRKLIPQTLAQRSLDRSRRHGDGWLDRPAQNSGAAPARRHARSRYAAHGRHRNAARDHAQASRARDRRQRAHRGRRLPHAESARSRRVRFRHQAAGRRFRPPAADRLRAGAEDQGRGFVRPAENDHHRAAGEAEGAAQFSRAAALALAHRGHRHFHRRSQRAAISFLAASGGFSRLPARRAAHARRIHRNVRAPARRIFGASK